MSKWTFTNLVNISLEKAKRKFLITAEPFSGKSRCILNIYNTLKEEGLIGKGWFTGDYKYINFEEDRLINGKIPKDEVFKNPNITKGIHEMT